MDSKSCIQNLKPQHHPAEKLEIFGELSFISAYEALWLWRFGLHCIVYGVGCVGRPRAQGVAMGVEIRVMALSERARQPMPDFAEADFFASVCGFLVLMPMQGMNLPKPPNPNL